jgi:hypothetical protein
MEEEEEEEEAEAEEEEWCIAYLSEDHHSFLTNHTRIAE